MGEWANGRMGEWANGRMDELRITSTGQLAFFWYNVSLACVKWAFSHHARWRLGVFLYGFAKKM